jgi:hypothetical protein
MLSISYAESVKPDLVCASMLSEMEWQYGSGCEG